MQSGEKQFEKKQDAKNFTLIITLIHIKRFTILQVSPAPPIKPPKSNSGKPNSLHDTAEGEEDPNFLHIMREIRVEPRKKYEFPVTESQEIGWESRPLLDGNTNSKAKSLITVANRFPRLCME